MTLFYHTLCDTGVLQHLALVSFWPHFSYSCFILSSTLVLPCPCPLILLVLSSGIISSQLQEDSTSCAPAHHHQASYLCDSPEQYRVHPRCLPGGQASTGRSVDHGQPRPSHLQLHRQPRQHQGGHHGHGVSSRQEAHIFGQPHLRPDMRQSSAGVQGRGVPQNPTFLYWDTGNDRTNSVTQRCYLFTHHPAFTLITPISSVFFCLVLALI